MKSQHIIMLCLLLGCVKLSKGQTCIPYEQSALTFFADSILNPQSIIKFEKVSFSFQTEAEYSEFGTMGDCFTKDSAIRIGLYKSQANRTKPKPVSLAVPNQFKVRKAAKWIIRVYKVNEYDGNFYVRIDLIKKRSFMNTYFVMFNDTYCIEKWCLTGKIW